MIQVVILDQKIFQIWNIWRNQQMVSNFDFIFQEWQSESLSQRNKDDDFCN